MPSSSVVLLDFLHFMVNSKKAGVIFCLMHSQGVLITDKTCLCIHFLSSCLQMGRASPLATVPHHIPPSQECITPHPLTCPSPDGSVACQWHCLSHHSGPSVHLYQGNGSSLFPLGTAQNKMGVGVSVSGHPTSHGPQDGLHLLGCHVLGKLLQGIPAHSVSPRRL